MQQTLHLYLTLLQNYYSLCTWNSQATLQGLQTGGEVCAASTRLKGSQELYSQSKANRQSYPLPYSQLLQLRTVCGWGGGQGQYKPSW